MNNYLDLKNKNEYKKLQIPSQIIKNGGIVVFPTETVYGIGANGLNEGAVQRLYQVKRRPLNKPTTLLVSDFDMIERVAKDISDIEYKIMKEFFPGPLTIILNKKEIVPSILTSNTNTVGIRMPANQIALELIRRVGNPIATSSANIGGEKSGTDIESIKKVFKNNVDFYIDGGQSEIGIGSTVVQIIDGVPRIYREGSISKEQIERVIVTSQPL